MYFQAEEGYYLFYMNADGFKVEISIILEHFRLPVDSFWTGSILVLCQNIEKDISNESLYNFRNFGVKINFRSSILEPKKYFDHLKSIFITNF